MKKKAVAATVVFAISLIAIFISIDIAEANTPLLDRSLSLAGLSQQLNTPEKIAAYIWRNFAFEQDQRQFGQEDYWQSPAELLQTQKGDCEDFALFAQELLKRNGYKPFLLSVYDKNGKFSHTVCVFKEGNAYELLDGNNFKRIHASGLKELIQTIHHFWAKAAIVAPAPTGNLGIILSEVSR